MSAVIERVHAKYCKLSFNVKLMGFSWLRYTGRLVNTFWISTSTQQFVMIITTYVFRGPWYYYIVLINLAQTGIKYQLRNDRTNKQINQSSERIFGKVNERYCIIHLTHSVFRSSNVLLIGEMCCILGRFDWTFQYQITNQIRRPNEIIRCHWNKI